MAPGSLSSGLQTSPGLPDLCWGCPLNVCFLNAIFFFICRAGLFHMLLAEGSSMTDFFFPLKSQGSNS